MQIIRFNAVANHRAHERFQRRRIIINAPQQNGLPKQRHACFRQPGQRPRRIGREFACMIGMHRDENRLGLAQRRHQRPRHPGWVSHWHARVDAQRFNMRDISQPAQNLLKPPG